MNTANLFDGHLTGHLFLRGHPRKNYMHFNHLLVIGLFDGCLTARLAPQAGERRILGLLREVTE